MAFRPSPAASASPVTNVELVSAAAAAYPTAAMSTFGSSTSAAAAVPSVQEAVPQTEEAWPGPSCNDANAGCESGHIAAPSAEDSEAAAAMPLQASSSDGTLGRPTGPRLCQSAAASPSVSAATSAFAGSDTSAQSAEEATTEADEEVDEEAVQVPGQRDVCQQIVNSSQPPMTPQMETPVAADVQLGRPVLGTEAATAQVGGKPFTSQALSAGYVQQRLGRDAGIAQVLASLNCIPTHSESSQQHFVSNSMPSHQTTSAQLTPVSMSKLLQRRSHSQSNLSEVSQVWNPVSPGGLSQQTETTRHESTTLHVSPRQAEATHLVLPSFGELPPQLQAAQPLSPVSVSHSLQQLSPVSMSHLPQQAGLTNVNQLAHPLSPFGSSRPHQQADTASVESWKPKGLPQTPSLAHFRGIVCTGPMPLQSHSEQSQPLGNSPVSLQQLETGMPTPLHMDKSLESRQGKSLQL